MSTAEVEVRNKVQAGLSCSTELGRCTAREGARMRINSDNRTNLKSATALMKLGLQLQALKLDSGVTQSQLSVQPVIDTTDTIRALGRTTLSPAKLCQL
jgi:hypothetical protein